MKKILATLTVFSLFLTTTIGQPSNYQADYTFTRACKGDTTHFVSKPVYPSTDTVILYMWDMNGDFIFELTGPTMTEVDYFLPNGPGVYDIGHKVKFASGQQQSVYRQVPMADVLADFSSENYCFSDITKFYDKSVALHCAIVDYYWEFGTGYVSKAKNPTYVYPAFGDYQVSLTVTSDNGCIHKDTKTVTINDLPHITLDYSRDSIPGHTGSPYFKFFKGQDMTVTLSIIGPYTNIIWSNGNVGLTNLITESGYYTVEVENEFGCSVTLGFTVDVVFDESFNPMPLFTPNSDNYNDVWKIKSFIMPGEQWDVTIYNRYGDEVYHSSTYNNDWDGKYEGNLLPDGTYYYQIKEKIKNKEYTGALNILTKN